MARTKDPAPHAARSAADTATNPAPARDRAGGRQPGSGQAGAISAGYASGAPAASPDTVPPRRPCPPRQPFDQRGDRSVPRQGRGRSRRTLSGRRASAGSRELDPANPQDRGPHRRTRSTHGRTCRRWRVPPQRGDRRDESGNRCRDRGTRQPAPDPAQAAGTAAKTTRSVASKRLPGPRDRERSGG
jgi:hypothetical protein